MANKIRESNIDDGAVTSAKLASGTVANNRLQNNSITINGSSVALGGSVTVGETKPTISSVSPDTITNDAQNIVITGTNFVSIPKVDIINTATGIWYPANSVSFNSTTQLTVNVTLTVDASTYRIRVENPDGNSVLSSANFLTVSDQPTWNTSAGSLGTKSGGFSGTVATLSASSDSAITYSETTNVLTNASLANCSLNSATGEITTTDFDGPGTEARTHTFTIRATDAEGQYVDRQFTLTSSYTYTGDFLVVGGGGGAGYITYYGGGGGGGGVRTSYGSTSGGGSSAESDITFNGGTTYTITVGAGGSAGGGSTAGTNGGDSSISGSGLTTITALGGGRGGYHNGPYDATTGGSGGGGSGDGGSGTAVNGASGTANQGYAGGNGDYTGGGNGLAGGGGGGAGGAGTSTSTGSGAGGAGGPGLQVSITGSAVYYGAGGGGGRGFYGSATYGADGTGWTGNSNTGDGGSVNSNAGLSGVVILRVPTTNYSGNTTGSPTVTTSGSDTIIKFTASGSYTA